MLSTGQPSRIPVRTGIDDGLNSDGLTVADDHGAHGSTYTVVGVWTNDQPVSVGVIAGMHHVRGGDDGEYFPQGVWATSVIAADTLHAEREAIAQMRADND